MTTILLIVDAATGMCFLSHHCRPTKLTAFAGGKIRFNTEDNKVHYGDWNPNAVRCHTTPFTRTQTD